MSLLFRSLRDGAKRRFPALASRNFRYFIGGQSISLFGTWMQRTALVWVVYTKTHSAFLVGLLEVVQFLPALLLSLFVGVYIDRHNKRNILIFAQTVLMIQALALGILTYTDVAQYWHICVLSFIMGLASSIEMPTRQSFVIEMVGKKALLNAIALNSTTFNVARVLGPALAGFAMETMGASTCFLLNAISFLPVIWGLTKIDLRDPPPRRARESSVLQDVKEGIRYILCKPELKSTFFVMLSVCTFSLNNEVIVPAFVKEVLGASGREYSILVSATGVGALLAAFSLATQTRREPKKSHLGGAALLGAVTLMLLFFAKGLVVSYVLLSVAGFLNVMFLNLSNTTIQVHSEDRIRGRVMGVYAVVTLGSTPLGNLLAGTATQHLGAPFGFFFCGTLTLVTCLLGISASRHTRTT